MHHKYSVLFYVCIYVSLYRFSKLCFIWMTFGCCIIFSLLFSLAIQISSYYFIPQALLKFSQYYKRHLVTCGNIFNNPLVDLRWSFAGSETWHLCYSVQTHPGMEGAGARHAHSALVHGNAMWVYGGMQDLQPRADLCKWDFSKYPISLSWYTFNPIFC